MLTEHQLRLLVLIASFTMRGRRVPMRARLPHLVELRAVFTGKAQAIALALLAKHGVLRNVHAP